MEDFLMKLQQASKTYFILVLLAALAVLTHPAPAKADLMTYHYTGNTFTQENVPDLGTQLTGFVQVDIPVHFTGTVAPASFLDWSLTAGSVTLTPALVTLSTTKGLDFQDGKITDWEILAIQTDPLVIISTKHGNTKDTDATGTGPMILTVEYNLNHNPGIWTCDIDPVSTPLPSAALLFVAGLTRIVLRSRSKIA
jgi:hypothetical protein